MKPSYCAGRYLMNASGVSYMWLSASNTGKSRTRDGMVTPYSIVQSLPCPVAGPPGTGHQVSGYFLPPTTLPAGLRQRPTRGQGGSPGSAARTWARRDSGAEQRPDPAGQIDAPCDRILQRQPHVGQVEVLHAEQALVAERGETGDHGREVDVPLLVDVHLGPTGAGLTQLDVIGQVGHLQGVVAAEDGPSRIEGEAEAGHGLAHGADR